SNLIRSFLHEKNASTVVVRTDGDGTFILNGHLRDVACEFNLNERRIYINRSSFKDWCRNKHHDMDLIVNELVASGLAIHGSRKHAIASDTTSDRGRTL